ncbi:MAG: PAS domain-containing protein [Acidobacteria bacterium]|nr:MAG: PAS domain-containing protein [Acidobacteriota bacterium]
MRGRTRTTFGGKDGVQKEAALATLREEGAKRIRVAVRAGEALRRRARQAAALIEADLTSAEADDADALVVDFSGDSPDAAARRLGTLRGGAAAVVACAPARAARLREAICRAGADDLVTPGVSARELAQRIRRAVRARRLEKALAAREQEVELIASLAGRLARSGDTRELFEEALAGMGRSLGLGEAALLVLSSPWRVESAAPEAVFWTREKGLRREREVPLSPPDWEALRRGSSVADPRAGIVTLPLFARGQALAVMRVRGRDGRLPAGAARRAIARVAGLLAGAIENAERLASLMGRSRSLEALVRERTREAEQQKRLFQAVIDALPVSLHAIDRSFRVVVWNLVREEGPFGRPRGEVLGRNLFSVIGDDPALKREYERVFATGQPTESEVRSRSGDPPRLFRVEKIPMRLDRSGEVTHVITIGRDVTEQRALERSMARAEKMAAVGRLAAGIAHEINNPLATIASCAEAMRNRLAVPVGDEEREEIRADAEVIEEEAYRCKSILGSLLDFSRSAPDEKGPCDLLEVARKTVRLLRHNPRLGGFPIEIDAAPDVPPVLANESQLVQVLMALLLNAADASAPGTPIRVVARPGAGDSAILSVIDRGPGIPPELRERIFEPFFTTKPPGQGTGLGLAVAYGIVRAHGGRLELAPASGRGARFDVVLPAMKPAGAEVHA